MLSSACRNVFKRVSIPHSRHVASKPQLPFPTGSPTPDQIFHLPRNASQADVKARCAYLQVSVYVICSTRLSLPQTLTWCGYTTPTRWTSRYPPHSRTPASRRSQPRITPSERTPRRPDRTRRMQRRRLLAQCTSEAGTCIPVPSYRTTPGKTG
jgi:hypothetical protein